MYFRGANPVAVNIVRSRYHAPGDERVIGDDHSQMTGMINHSLIKMREAALKAMNDNETYTTPSGDDQKYLAPQCVYINTPTTTEQPIRGSLNVNILHTEPMGINQSPAYEFMMFQREHKQREREQEVRLDHYHSNIGLAIQKERPEATDANHACDTKSGNMDGQTKTNADSNKSQGSAGNADSGTQRG